MKTLYLIRHAKSSWKDLSLEDIERPLNKRGKKDAPLIGQYLKKKGATPDLLISSPAKRAYTTAKLVAKELDYDVADIVKDKKIYVFDYSGKDVMEVVRNIKNKHDVVMIFGHNPTFSHLSNSFTDKQIEEMPTCGTVCFQFDTDKWKEIEDSEAELIFSIHPKML
ncbi:MAG: histidine phosphatase family protein [Chitinophagales bacterium]